MLADPLGEARVERRELEVGPVLVDQLRRGRPCRGSRVVSEMIASRGVEPSLDDADQLVGHVRLELEPDDPAAPPALDRGAEVADQILGFFLDLDVAVADDPEGAAAEHLVFREQIIGLAADQRLERDVARRSSPGMRMKRGRVDGRHQQLADRLPSCPS
jgi:hypothetical protein